MTCTLAGLDMARTVISGIRSDWKQRWQKAVRLADGRYRKYFYHRLSTDKEFRKRIGNLQGKTLGCFCKPDPCHGDIIKEYLDWMAENANEAIVIGQIHWKGCVYPVREIDAGNHIFRVSVESLRNELANDMRNGIYEAMEASEEIDGYCTDEELCTLSDTDLYKMYC